MRECSYLAHPGWLWPWFGCSYRNCATYRRHVKVVTLWTQHNQYVQYIMPYAALSLGSANFMTYADHLIPMINRAYQENTVWMRHSTAALTFDFISMNIFVDWGNLSIIQHTCLSTPLSHHNLSVALYRPPSSEVPLRSN